jgi:adenylate cyclase
MTAPRPERRLAAVLVADVAGYARLMGRDEAGTLARLKACRRELLEPLLAEYRGRIVNFPGDNALCEFASVVDAVECAVAIQRRMLERERGVPEPERLRFRIGVNLGDVLAEKGDLYGEGVNIAARLQELAEPGSVMVSGAAYDQLQGTFGSDFDYVGERRLKNIERSVRLYQLAGLNAAARGTDFGTALPAEGASIAVLPFANPAGDPKDEFLAHGIVDELAIALSRMRSLLVIAPGATLPYQHREVDVRSVGRELGVRYVPQGSVRRSGDRVRITVRLIETGTGGHVWADHVEGRHEDTFGLQDRVIQAVIGAVQPSLRSAEVWRARRKRPDSLDAYDCVMRALPSLWLSDAAANAEALRLLQKAIDLDPGYALAKAVAAWCHAQRATYHWAPPAEAHAEALRLAAEAERLDNDDPAVLTMLGAAHTLARDFALASALLEKALVLDPNLAWAWNRSGWLHHFLSRPEVAIEHFHRALRVSPLDTTKFNTLIGIGCAHFKAARYDACAEWVAKGIVERPSAVWARRVLASAYAQLGRLDEARREVAALLEAYPDVTVAAVVRVLPADADYVARLTDGLRLAGLPE